MKKMPHTVLTFDNIPTSAKNKNKNKNKNHILSRANCSGLLMLCQ